MMLTEYKDIGLRAINTSEAYSKVFFIGNKNAVIPYINVGLMPDNPINGIVSFAEYSFYAFFDINSIVFNAEETIHLDFGNAHKNPLFEEYISLDGCHNSNGAEVKISCNRLSFYIPINSRISKASSAFIPIHTPKYKQNMDDNEVRKFFSEEGLPKEIKDILGDDFYMMFLSK